MLKTINYNSRRYTIQSATAHRLVPVEQIRDGVYKYTPRTEREKCYLITEYRETKNDYSSSEPYQYIKSAEIVAFNCTVPDDYSAENCVTKYQYLTQRWLTSTSWNDGDTQPLQKEHDLKLVD
jgi:hypothetical protein